MNNKTFTPLYMAVVLAAAHLGFAQGQITITGGPGSADSAAPAELPSPTSQTAASGQQSSGNPNGYSTVSEERIRQIVREELQRAGLIPPLGMNTAPVGVSPNPFSPPRSATNGLPTNSAAGLSPTGSLVGVARGGTNAVGVLVPRRPVTTLTPTGPSGTSAAGAPAPGGSVGVLSGGSSGVGVATPSGAGANRSTAGNPPTSSAGTPGTGATSSSTGR